MKLTPLEDWITHKAGLRERKRELLEEYQLNRIRKTVRYAKNNSRFYRELFRNVDADGIHSFADIRNIPFTHQQDISKDPFAFLCVPQSEIKRIVTLQSSGTSGADKRIFFTEEDLNQTVEFFRYGMNCLANKKDRVLVLLPGNTYGSIGNLLKKALSESGIACFVPGVMADAGETAGYIEENRITCIVGIPIQVLQLSRTESETFRKIKKVLLSTDYVPQTLIEELSSYGCRVFTHYGMTEMGYGGGVECEALKGYHMREAELYFEIVDPVSGENVKDGQLGEVVFTTLLRMAMPLIRYKTGDIASFSAKPCACGTLLKTMNRVRGRADNRICLAENQFLYLAELDEAILSSREVLDYSVCLAQEGYLHLEIATQDNQVFESFSEEIVLRVRKLLLDKFRDNSLRIEVTPKNERDMIKNSMVKRKIYDLR